MWEALGESAKIFIEKHLIPTVIAVVAAIVALLILPSDYWMIVKIGKRLFFVLVAGIVFLIVKLLGCLHEKSVRRKNNKDINALSNYMAEQRAEEKVKELWNEVDNLAPADRNMVKHFVLTGNKPIKIENRIYPYGSFLNSRWTVSTEIDENSNDESFENASIQVIGGHEFFPAGRTKLYKLNDDVYQLLKYSWDKYGKISNFD